MSTLVRNSIRAEDGMFLGVTCARHCRLSSEQGDYINKFFDVCIGDVVHPSLNHYTHPIREVDPMYTLDAFVYFEGGRRPDPYPSTIRTCKDELYLVNPHGMVFGRIRERQRPIDRTLFLHIHQPTDSRWTHDIIARSATQ